MVSKLSMCIVRYKPIRWFFIIIAAEIAEKMAVSKIVSRSKTYLSETPGPFQKLGVEGDDGTDRHQDGSDRRIDEEAPHSYQAAGQGDGDDIVAAGPPELLIIFR